MAALPVEVLLGIYLGLLVGVIPALIAWSMAFVFKYFTGVTLPGFGVMVLSVALAGVNGGLLALTDKSITQNPAAPRIITAILLVAMMAMYAHSKGDSMGATFPHRLSFRGLREKTLSLDLADVIPDRNEVRITVAGEVADVEGYPPLSAETRAEIRTADFTFPADLPIGELEARFESRLETEFDLGQADVTIDERGHAVVAAAPPFSGLSRRVGEGRRAVSINALVPTGLARGDEVTCITPDATVRGTVVSAQSGHGETAEPAASAAETPPSESDGPVELAETAAPTTRGGEGRLTVAVARSDVEPLLAPDRATVVVESRGTRREYEAISLLRRAGRRFRRVTVGESSELAGQTIAEASLRDTYDVAVLARRAGGDWQLTPAADTHLEAGDELVVVGRLDALRAFGEVIS
jgi:hypothetical protein